MLKFHVFKIVFVFTRISLIRNAEKLQAQDHLIVQEYLDKPFLMEGYKFDLRVYILVTSCDPLKVFLYHDGLVRMGTEKYHPPSDSNLVSWSSFQFLLVHVDISFTCVVFGGSKIK